MPPCPCCESENVIRTDPMQLEYECLNCHEEFVDWVDSDEWFDSGEEAEAAKGDNFDDYAIV
jgi:hypothetical protein